MKSPKSQVSSPKSKTKKILFIFFFFMTLDFGLGTLDSLRADPGSSAAQFLKMDVTARAAAMGGTALAGNQDAAAINLNPALLALGPSQQAVLSHSDAPGFYQFHYAAYSARRGNVGLGASATSLEYANLLKTDNAGQITGDFSARDQNITLALAKLFGPNLSAGLSVKNVRQTIDDASGSALALDAGGLFKRGSWQFALGAANWGTPLEFDRESAPLPNNLRTAASYCYAPEGSGDDSPVSSLNAEIGRWRDSGVTWRLGAEHWLAADTPTQETLWFAWRAGYRSEISTASEPLAAFTTGIGIWYESFGLDFAFQPSAGFGNIYQLGARWQW
ncbi:MAG: PorV/PorQ family protein [Elusimicrobia bacterium]|nr:PorV/PorQ family protein [Elusimicrobiota bacterium]